MSGALQGLKVLDLSRWIAGPYCAQLLGDLGADVVKVERADGGEEMRGAPPEINGESIWFMAFNRNKKSITVDFRHPGAQNILRALAKEADILLENFRPGTMEKMGCGPDVLRKINPRLIFARVTGFGSQGPLANRPCFDGAAQALGGIMSLTGDPDGPPMRTGTFLVDYSTALYATIAILGALEARHRTGEGQTVEATMLDSAMSLLGTAIPEFLTLGRTVTRTGNRDRYTAPCQCFKSKDGKWLYMVCGTDTHFAKLVRSIGMPELLDDPRFVTKVDRLNNVTELETIIGAWVAEHLAGEVMAAFEEAQVPCEIVATIADVVANPQVVHGERIVNVSNAKAGNVPFHSHAYNMSSTPPSIRQGSPVLGEHTYAVLSDWLKLSDGEIRQLAAEKAVTLT